MSGLPNTLRTTFGLFYFEDQVEFKCLLGYKTKLGNSSIVAMCDHTKHWIFSEQGGCFGRSMQIKSKVSFFTFQVLLVQNKLAKLCGLTDFSTLEYPATSGKFIV